MIYVQESEIQTRFDSLPSRLKGALLSTQGISDLRSLCSSYQVNDPEDVSIIEQLVGLVLLGYMSPNDLSEEISSETDIHIKDSYVLAKAIQNKIFLPVQSELEEFSKQRDGKPAPPKQEAPLPAPAEPPKINPEHLKVELKFKPGVAREEISPKIFPAPKAAPYTINIQQHLSPQVAAQQTPQKQKPAGETPFILHRETELEPVTETSRLPVAPRVETQRRPPSPGIQVHFSDDEKKRAPAQHQSPPPQRTIRYTTPTPAPRIAPAVPTPAPRPAPPQKPTASSGEMVVDLSTFKKTQPPKPSQQPNSGPQVDGNTVDLR